MTTLILFIYGFLTHLDVYGTFSSMWLVFFFPFHFISFPPLIVCWCLFFLQIFCLESIICSVFVDHHPETQHTLTTLHYTVCHQFELFFLSESRLNLFIRCSSSSFRFVVVRMEIWIFVIQWFQIRTYVCVERFFTVLIQFIIEIVFGSGTTNFIESYTCVLWTSVFLLTKI